MSDTSAASQPESVQYQCPACAAPQQQRAFCISCGAAQPPLSEASIRGVAVADDEESGAPVPQSFKGAARALHYEEEAFTVGPDVARAAVREAGLSQAESHVRASRPSPVVPISRRSQFAPPVAPSQAPAFQPPRAEVTEFTASPDAQKTVATKGLRGALSRVGIRLAPGAVEAAAIALRSEVVDYERVIRQATWTRAVSVLVANTKGGVGKTPVSLILGGVLGSVRGGSVCVLEVADDSGALSFRAEGTPMLGVGELARDVATITSAGRLAGYTAPQSSFASVIGSTGHRPALTRDDVVAIASVIDEFYAIRIMDSGNQGSSSAFAGALETADVLVVPILNSGDSALEGISMVQRLAAMGGREADLARHAVVLRLSDGRPELPWVVEGVDKLLADAGIRHVVNIPYDEHIADRGQITIEKLSPPTYRAFAAATAAIVQALHINVRNH